EGERAEEAERSSSCRGDVAEVHGDEVPSDLRRTRPLWDVGADVHGVRRRDEVVVPPVHDADVMPEADREAAVEDLDQDLDRSALPDVLQGGHTAETRGAVLTVRPANGFEGAECGDRDL